MICDIGGVEMTRQTKSKYWSYYHCTGCKFWTTRTVTDDSYPTFDKTADLNWLEKGHILLFL